MNIQDELRDGGPAFPETRWDDITRQNVQWGGMTLRDWFAGQAISGILSRDPDLTVGDLGKLSDIGLSQAAYFYADAMLKARKGEQP